MVSGRMSSMPTHLPQVVKRVKGKRGSAVSGIDGWQNEQSENHQQLNWPRDLYLNSEFLLTDENIKKAKDELDFVDYIHHLRKPDYETENTRRIITLKEEQDIKNKQREYLKRKTL